MRDLVLIRIKQIKSHPQNMEFKEDRFKSLEIDGIHISKVDFSKVNDKELLVMLERILRRHYTQM